MQLSFDAADRLVELVEASRGPVPADEAARSLFALASAPTAIARALLDDVVSGDARLAWRGAAVGLADPPGAATAARGRPRSSSSTSRRPGSRPPAPGSSRSAPSGSRRSRSGETFETLVNPGVPLPTAITALTGIGQGDVRGAPGADLAVRRFLAFAGDAVLVAHNARFDMGFLDRAVERLTGRRVAAPVVDTVWLARRLLGGRTGRFGLAAARALLRHVGRTLPPGARRCLRHGGDPDRADRARAGARGGDGRRSRRAVGAAGPPPAREALARRRRADDPGNLRLP